MITKVHFDFGNGNAACRDRNAHSKKYALTTVKTEVTCTACLKQPLDYLAKVYAEAKQGKR